MTITPEPTQFSDKTPTVESNALKKKLQGLRVNASTYSSPTGNVVPVIFVGPDFELASAQYPGIYLSYAGVSRATDREVRGPARLQYAPAGYPTDVMVPPVGGDEDSDDVDWGEAGFDRLNSPYRVEDHPIPYNLDYNVTVLTRNYQQTFEIITQLQDIERIPERFGHLEVPEDGTVRTLELLGGPESTLLTDQSGKRVVQTIYSVRVTAELSLYEVQQVQRVMSVNIDFNETMENNPYL